MTVTIEQIQAGIIKYIDAEVGAQATGLSKFAVYFFAPSIPNMAAQKIAEIKESGLMPDLFDENGNIHLDLAYKRAKAAIAKSGRVLIPKLNYFIDDSDIEKICGFIKNS